MTCPRPPRTSVGVCLAVLALVATVQQVTGEALPTCSAGSPCVLSGTHTLEASKVYQHSADVTIDTGAELKCETDFCEVRIVVSGATLTVKGAVRAPMVRVTTKHFSLQGGTLSSSELGGLPGSGPGAGGTARSSSGGGAWPGLGVQPGCGHAWTLYWL